MKSTKTYLSIIFLMLVSYSLSACSELTSSFSRAHETRIPFTPIALAAAVTPLPQNSPTPAPLPRATGIIATAPSAVPAVSRCDQRKGQVERHEVPFDQQPRSFVFRVYLPPCFDRNASVRYPVLYMIHGQNYTEDQWDRLGIDDAADALISAEEIQPFLIVMPLESNTLTDPTQSSFANELTDSLVPWIDHTFPTCTDRACRAIGGLSRGGAWALRIGFQRWDLFSAIGLHSTPPFIGDMNQFPYWVKKIPKDRLPVVYMDLGQQDQYKKPNTEFEQLLVQYQVPHEWYAFNGMHTEEYWAAHVSDYLTWYGEHWKLVPEGLLLH